MSNDLSTGSPQRTYAIPEDLVGRIRAILEAVSSYSDEVPNPDPVLETLDALTPLAAPVAPGPFPDRLASYEGDPGHEAWKRVYAAGFIARIQLNGEDAGMDVTMADPRLGVLRRGVTDSEGRLRISGDAIIEEDLHGEVRITLEAQK